MCISGAPADGTNFHVSFYPGPRLTAHSYKKFSAGSPADGSQRVKSIVSNGKSCLFDKLVVASILTDGKRLSLKPAVANVRFNKKCGSQH